MKIKGFVRACAFSSVCIFVIILLITVGLSVSADGNISVIDTFGVTAADVLNKEDFALSSEYISGADSAYISTSSALYNNTVSGVNNGGFTIPSFSSNTIEDTWIQYAQNNFVIFGVSSNQANMYLCPQGSFICYVNGSMFLCMPKQVLLDDGLISGSTTTLYSFNFTNANFQRAMDSVWFDYTTIDGTDYTYFQFTNNTAFSKALVTSMPIYYNGGSAITTLTGVDNINYSSINSAATSESASNNLVLENGDWTFSNSTFTAPYAGGLNTGSIYPNGTISFKFFPNDYQREHSSDFTITFSFSFDYDVNYKNWSNSSFGPFEQTSQLSNNQLNYSSRLVYNDSGVEYIDVPLTQFITGGNSKSFTFEEVFSKLSATYDYPTLLNQSKELDYVEYNKFNVNCVAFISSGSNSSGNISEWYNPMNKKGYTTDKSGNVNTNPYSGGSTPVSSVGSSAPGTAGNNGDNSNNIGGGSSSNGSGNSDAYSSVGNITINNNNTAYGGNGNGGGGSGGSETSEAAISMWNTFNPFKLIFNKLTGDVTDISDDVAETLGANGYISVLSTTFGFLPTECWTVLTWFLGATLAILIVGVILRILLDLL